MPFYEYGVIHGDPHLGNYTVRKDNSINLMDFGSVRIVPPKLIYAIIMLFEALKKGSRNQAVEAYQMWGFVNLNNKLIDALQVWAQFIYAPFLENSVCSLEKTHAMPMGRETARRVYEEIKKNGSELNIPPEFMLIDRASIGLGSVFLRLHAEINWRRALEELIADFDVKKCAVQQKKILSVYGLDTK